MPDILEAILGPFLRVFKWMAVAIGVLLVAVVFLAFKAFGHEGHTVTNAQYQLQAQEYQRQNPGERVITGIGTHFLYGIRTDKDDQKHVNCCTEKTWDGKQGDCKPIDESLVKIVPGGYLVRGQFIANARTNVSPDDLYYACQHDNGEPIHCFFAPPAGF